MPTTTQNGPTENIHSVANFNPADYEVLDYLDNQRPRYAGEPMAAYEMRVQVWKREIARYFPTSACVSEGNVQQLPEHNIHKCRHCGNTNVRYIVACLHRPTGVNVVFGDVCVDHLGFANHQQFRAAQLRARAAQGNANLRAYRQRLQFLEQHPAFKELVESGELTHPVHANNAFVKDVIAKFDKYGVLSERQVESVIRSCQRDHEFARRRTEQEREELIRRATAQPAPNGRLTVEGKVIMVKDYGFDGISRWKMLMLLTNGSKVFVSVPTSLVNQGNVRDLRDKCIRLTATWAQKPDDTLFAYGKRPTNAEVIPCPVSVADVQPETTQAEQEQLVAHVDGQQVTLYQDETREENIREGEEV